jgi:hypothetical protein
VEDLFFAEVGGEVVVLGLVGFLLGGVELVEEVVADCAADEVDDDVGVAAFEDFGDDLEVEGDGDIGFGPGRARVVWVVASALGPSNRTEPLVSV